MIRFCDKKAYSINEDELSRGELFSFFIRNKENMTDIITVYDGVEGKFLGIITYNTLLFGVGGNEDSYINKTKLYAKEDFWTKAREYFAKYPKELLTVVDESEEILGFAYYEEDEFYALEFSYLEEAEKTGIPILHTLEYSDIKMLVITDLNELAWKCYHIFKKEGLHICVIGEKWEWFGYKSGEGYLDFAEFEKLYIYAEGIQFRRKERINSVFRFGNVQGFFIEVFELLIESAKQAYINEIEKIISRGATICEISIPLINDITYRTKLENEGSFYSGEKICTIYNLLKNGKDRFVSNEEKKLLEKIYGKEVMGILNSKKCERLGLNQAEIYKIGTFSARALRKGSTKKIYVIGPCIVEGGMFLFDNTLASYIQQIVDKHNYAVIGVPIDIASHSKWNSIISNLSLCEDDIVLIINKADFFKKRLDCERIDMSYIYNDKERKTLFFNEPIHSNVEGNSILAKEIYNIYLKKQIEISYKKRRKFIQQGNVLGEDEILQVNNYVNTIKYKTSGSVGAIVMNCNPFTYGHQYLIEYSATKVDWLYIFIVEENRSFFSFEDRMAMVKKGTAHLSNVLVVPSGNFVLSYETLPVYFEKTQKQEVLVDARMDLEIFARYIAPPLHIIKRFVGEEPTDKVTRQYNEQMLEIFEPFELTLEIIPRKELDGQAISASSVRRCMQEGKWEEIKKLVPETTFEMCRNYITDGVVMI